jgi:hypothetical protein
VSDVAFSLFLLCAGLGLARLTVAQFRTREATGETIFDVGGAIFPALKRPMFWASTAFLGLLAAVGLVGAAAFFVRALGVS